MPSKLVRDNIPAIIAAEGRAPTFYQATMEEYSTLLSAKLREEAEEFAANPSAEELADVLEVVDALLTAYSWTWEDIRRVQAEKREARGGFLQRFVLELS